MKAEEIRTPKDLGGWLLSFPEGQAIKHARTICIREFMRQIEDLVGVEEIIAHPLTMLQVLLFGLNSLHDALPSTTALQSAISLKLGAQSNRASWFVSKADSVRSTFDMCSNEGAQRVTDAFSEFIMMHSAMSGHILPETKKSNPIFFDHPEFGASSTTYALGIGANIFSDIQVIAQGGDPLSSALFPSTSLLNPSVAPTLSELTRVHSGYYMLLTIFENALHARPQNWPLLTALAQKDAAFWTGTDTEVLDRIAGVMEGFGSRHPATSNPELSPDQVIDRALKMQT
jgi:hypothetical protein